MIVWLINDVPHRRRQLMIPKIINKSHSPHVLETMPAKQKQKKKKKKKNVVKCTDVVPAKYTPKVKLENFHNSRFSELGKIMRTLVCEGF